MARRAMTLPAKVAVKPVIFPHHDDMFKCKSEANKETASNSADPRKQGPLYVEARGYLQPAVDFYVRAVRAADALGSTSGELLASVSIILY
jgi:hypothetical protein